MVRVRGGTPGHRSSTGSSIRALRGASLRWYRGHRRELPWRRTRDPYAVWVSEVMLQQTRVAMVVPYYRRFMDRFPDPRCLSRATEDEVLSVWSGLGYYRRARALHAGARVLMERHGGALPREPAALLALPGVGRYTAGAIASIAFGRPEPCLDGNVRRVLSRLYALRGRHATDGLLWELAGRLVRGPHPGELNQALMELGALVCTPADPACEVCPVALRCRARGQGEPEAYPAARPRPPAERVRVAVAFVRRGGRLLLERPGSRNPFRGTWDLPALELRRGPVERLRRELVRRHGIEIEVGNPLGRAEHGIMNRRLRLEVFACRLRPGGAGEGAALRWVRPDELDATPVSGATRKVVRLVSRQRPSHGGRRAFSSQSGGSSGSVGIERVNR